MRFPDPLNFTKNIDDDDKISGQFLNQRVEYTQYDDFSNSQQALCNYDIKL